MTEATPQGEPAAAAAAAPAATRRPSRWRWARRSLAIFVALFAAAVVWFVSIDLGPQLRGLAERRASEYLERPMHIGKLVALPRAGRFRLDAVVVEGLTPEAKPFLKARHIYVTVPWWTLFDKELHLEFVVEDWDVTIESFAKGHSIPKIMPKTRSTGPKWYTTTIDNVWARNGAFTYIDHATPWSITTRDFTMNFVRADNLNTYLATTEFKNGTIRIMDYLPMSARMTNTRLKFDGPLVRVQHMDLVTDGAVSKITGQVNTRDWPEQQFNIQSRMNFQRMREIFFARETWKLGGDGRFTGTFQMVKGGHREVIGTFTSELATVNGVAFPNLRGSVEWLPQVKRLWVHNAESDFYGGRMRFTYLLVPPSKGAPVRATYRTQYADVDLASLRQGFEWNALELEGRATGWHDMEWPSGFFPRMTGNGDVTVTPPAGVALAPVALPGVPRYARKEAPFIASRPLGPVPLGAHVTYRMDPEWVEFSDSWAATPDTYVSFKGRTAWTENADLPFHVTSLDWQASDRLLSGVLTAFGSKTTPIEIGGRGVFDGRMTKSFRKPLITGTFSGDGFRWWDVTWGTARAEVAIEESYVTVSSSRIGDGAATIDATGKFSLGFPRKDGGDEMSNVRIKIVRWPVSDFRHAFVLDDWPAEGLVTANLSLFGRYLGPDGFGLLRVDDGVAWEEPFDWMTASLSFEKTGMRMDRMEIAKRTGLVQGAAWIGWPIPASASAAAVNGTYSFTVAGERIPVESLNLLTFPEYPNARLTGTLQFSASGSGSFDDPRYEVEGRIVDLFLNDEGVGNVYGHMVVDSEQMNIDVFEAVSARLEVRGSGRIALTPESDLDLTLRFTETSVDPYLRFIAPKLPQYTQAVVSGSVRISGDLSDQSRLVVDATIDRADLKLLDYALANSEPIRLSLEDNVFSVGRLQLKGSDTSLGVEGEVSMADRTLNIKIGGDASLALLQGFVTDVQSGGAAQVRATVTGTFDAPTYSGSVSIADGFVRHLMLPHRLEAINGTMAFNAGGINLEGLKARIGGGDVAFGGTIGMQQFVPDALDVTAVGTNMVLRFPEGFRSRVNANLHLTGSLSAGALLSGAVDVREAIYTRRLESEAQLLGLTGRDSVLAGGGLTLGPAAPASTLPVRFNVTVNAQQSIHIQNNDARVVASADVTFGGTWDRPTLTGRIDIDRAEVLFLGNRYEVTQGSITFSNPTKIEPFFDIEAETRVRQPGQDYRVGIRITGTADRFSPSFTSDPPLPVGDVIGLLAGTAVTQETAELRQLSSPQQRDVQVMQTFVTRLLASPITSQVGDVFEQILNLDTVQISPLLGTEQFDPSARLTIGQRITLPGASRRSVYLTYSRALSNSSQYEVILLEYDQNDRMSWVVSRNEDRSFAIDFRVRYRF